MRLHGDAIRLRGCRRSTPSATPDPKKPDRASRFAVRCPHDVGLRDRRLRLRRERSALRLAEKGYRVARRSRRASASARTTSPKTNWDVEALDLDAGARDARHLPDDVLAPRHFLHGVGVGGGSLVYANTLPMPTDDFFEPPLVGPASRLEERARAALRDGARMLGAAPNPISTPRRSRAQARLRDDMGRGDTSTPTDVAVYFGEPGETVPDPVLRRRGPGRAPAASRCGGCMTGCRYGAKNTLDKNYL